jgi:hypothetical protein
MEITGKIFRVLPLQSGESAKGKWQKQELILETEGKFPKKVCVSFWGELVANNKFEEGRTISVEADVESREYKERWYTEVKAWRVNRSDADQSASYSNRQATPAAGVETPYNDINDDLPF